MYLLLEHAHISYYLIFIMYIVSVEKREGG